jgi:hypothetical protein
MAISQSKLKQLAQWDGHASCHLTTGVRACPREATRSSGTSTISALAVTLGASGLHRPRRR